jgi:hypothetical protein
MGYDIPDKVRYKEKIVFGLDGKQLIYALIFGFATILAYGLPISGGLKFVLPSFAIILGLGFVFFRLEEGAMEKLSYLKALRLKKDMKQFANKVIQIGKIENDCVILSNKELRAVLQITPLNYALFDDDRKKALIGNYRDFLNHLNYPIQVVVRTKRASLEEYYQTYENSARGIKARKLKALYKDFKDHVTKFLELNKVNEREYYLIVCLRPESRIMEESANRLNERVQIAQEKLLDCGIESRRLTTGELMPFAVSYFNEAKDEKKTQEKEENPAQEAQAGAKEAIQ